MVYANKAMDAGEYFLSMGRYAGEEECCYPSVVRDILGLIKKYDSPALYTQFGRKRYKDERHFLRGVEEEYIREDIKPYIEKQVARVLDELTEAGLPLFVKGSRLDNFYKDQRVYLQSHPLRALVRFERTEEYTRYILRLAQGERIFYPADYALKILTRKPCRILSGRQLFRFPEDFDGQRLLPFLQKREILIPKANEQVYFRKFILKNVRYDEIEVQGFEVIVREDEKKAVLSLEREVFALPVLVLGFYYGQQYLPAWSERKALVELRTEGDTYAFYKVNRDFAWEQQQLRYLSDMGLTGDASGCFRPEGMAGRLDAAREKQEAGLEWEQRESAEAWRQTVEWLRLHREALGQRGIRITQKSLRTEYYIGEWRLDYTVREEKDWFELKAEVLLSDGRRIPFICFREAILAGRREYVLDNGSIFFIPEEWFAEYTEILLFAGGRGNSLFLHKSQYALLKQEESGHIRDKIERTEAAGIPAGLMAVLRPYQQVGYEWMYRLYKNGFGGCLADDMGLGKTLQMIALILKYRKETVKSAGGWEIATAGKQLSLFEENRDQGGASAVFQTCLIIVPASLVHNWQNELRKFAPELSVTIYAGNNRADLRSYLQSSDVVIVTYHTLRNDIDYIARLSFGVVVADEAQMIKNPHSRLHEAMMRVQGKWFFALSGTPVENSLTDLWAVMDYANRDMLGSLRFFRDHFIRPIITDTEGRMSVALKKMIAPYILRRTKEEVLSDLPELTSELVVCEPDEEQRKVYEEEQAKVRNYILGKRETQEGIRNDFMVLKALIRLRQVANHPRLIDEQYTGTSGKFREVFRMLEEVIHAGHKVLVFSSFVKYLKMVAAEAGRLGWEYATLTGLTTDREAEIRRFSTRPECRIFLISLKAGGVGLNLTKADYVFILDPWWNSAAENQAVGRAHRLGQKRAVFVYRFITAGTLEQKILVIQQRKQRLSDAVIAHSGALPLTDDELLEALEE